MSLLWGHDPQVKKDEQHLETPGWLPKRLWKKSQSAQQLKEGYGER